MNAASVHPETLDEWVAKLAPALGIEATDVPIGAVLDLARDAAHGVARPAAPVTTFLIGLAAGAGLGSVSDLAAKATALAAEWESQHDAPAEPGASDGASS